MQDNSFSISSVPANELGAALCVHCSAINFKTIFNSNISRDASVKISELNHLRRDIANVAEGHIRRLSECPLCNLFVAADLNAEDIYRNRNLKLTLNGTGLFAFRASRWYELHHVKDARHPGVEDNIVLAVALHPPTDERRGLNLHPTAVTNMICRVSPRGQTPIPMVRVCALDEKRVDFEVVREWLRTCDRFHDCHDTLHTDWMSTNHGLLKVIDCESMSVIDAPGRCGFVALSYVWGQEPRSNAATDEWNLQGGAFPTVVRDAITTTLKIGYRYLWIDKYCISQSDENAKRHQLQLMGKIYRSAQITLIAAAGEDSSYGLPGVNEKSRIGAHYVEAGEVLLAKVSLDSYDAASVDMIELIEHSRWNARGWTYQEAMFSRRRIYFTDRGVFFECQRMQRSDVIEETLWSDIYAGPRTRSLFQGVSDLSTAQSLMDTIEEFSGRELSYESDVLNALLGVLEEFSVLPTPVHHFWGLPFVVGRQNMGSVTDDLIRGLRWSINTHLVVGRTYNWVHMGKALRRTEFPSWSWVGWKGTVKFLDKHGWHSFKDSSARVWAERADGSRAEVGKVAGHIFRPWNDQSTTNAQVWTSPILHIESSTIQVRFVGWHVAIGGDSARRDLEAIVDEYSEPELFFGRKLLHADFYLSLFISGKGKAYIPLKLDADTSDDPLLRDRLTTEFWCAVIFGDVADGGFALIISHDGDGVAERIGILDFSPFDSHFRRLKRSDLDIEWDDVKRHLSSLPHTTQYFRLK